MLVLSRKVGERIWIGDEIAVTVVRITGGGVRIGIEAPNELPVVREELKRKMEEEAMASERNSENREIDPDDNEPPASIKFRAP